MSAARSIAQICAPRIATRLLVPTLVAIAVGWLCVRVHPDTASDPVDTAAAWLELPLLLVVAAAVLATVDAWPGFGRDRAEHALVERARPGPLGGAGVAMLVGCGLATVALAVVGLAFELALDRPANRAIDVVHPLTIGSGDAVRLDREHPRVRLALSHVALVDAIELRPQMPFGPEGTLVPTPIRILDSTGEPLGAEQVVERPGQLVRVAFAPRRLGAIELVHGAGGVPLFLPAGAASAHRGRAASARVAAAAAACTGVVSAAVALGLLVLLRRRLSKSLCSAAGILIPIATTAIGFTPDSTAVHAYARNQWPLSDDAFRAGFWSLSAIAAAMLLAVVTGRPRDAA